jgi:transcriptional regulator with XRE-family HTH domain
MGNTATKEIEKEDRLFQKFAEFMKEKREALGLSTTDLALIIYADEDYNYWKEYFANADLGNLTSAEKTYFKAHIAQKKKLSTKRVYIWEIETGVRQSLTFATMSKILQALNSTIAFDEN